MDNNDNAMIVPEPEFAHRNAENLVAKMNEVNEGHKRVGRVPSVTEVQKMIDQAKELPGVIAY